jgi:hypothetical protein
LKKAIVWLTLVVMVLCAGTVSARKFELDTLGDLEVTSYIEAKVADLSDPELNIDLVGELKYAVPIKGGLTFKVEDKLVLPSLQNSIDKDTLENELNIFLEYSINEIAIIKGGSKFDIDWERTDYLEVKVVWF